jgi:hypothetical protein
LFVNEFSSITLVLLPSLLHPSGSILWSRQGKLVPRDGVQSGYFGDKLALHDTTVVVSAKNDAVSVFFMCLCDSNLSLFSTGCGKRKHPCGHNGQRVHF